MSAIIVLTENTSNVMYAMYFLVIKCMLLLTGFVWILFYAVWLVSRRFFVNLCTHHFSSFLLCYSTFLPKFVLAAPRTQASLTWNFDTMYRMLSSHGQLLFLHVTYFTAGFVINYFAQWQAVRYSSKLFIADDTITSCLLLYMQWCVFCGVRILPFST